jgi:quercetin dioxygenase-like cupin family protein
MKITSLDDIADEGVSHNPEIRKQVLLRRGDVPPLMNFSRSRIAAGQIARAHRHADMCEIFFVESGSGTMKVDGQEHQLRAGTCIAIEPNEEHEISNQGTADLVLIYFGIQVKM